MSSKMISEMEARLNAKVSKAYEYIDEFYDIDNKALERAQEAKKVKTRKCQWLNCDNEISSSNKAQKFCSECKNQKRVSDLGFYDIPTDKKQYYVKYKNLKELKKLIGIED